MDDCHRGRHAVYLLTYHIVFVTKYRKKCIPEELGDLIKNECAAHVEGRGGTVISSETDKDHIHLLVDLPPTIAPTEMVRIMKTTSARMVHEDAKWGPYVSSFYRGDRSILWAPSYFITTTGTTSLEKVKEYLSAQRTEEHHRKYNTRSSQKQ